MRRWPQRLLLIALLLVALYLGRAQLLRAAAGLLIAEDPLEPCDAVLMLGGDRVYSTAAQLYRDGVAKRILLIETAPTRTERMGLQPTEEARARRVLEGEGVPAEAFTVLPAGAYTDWERARRLLGWLHEHPGARVTVLCARFNSRRLRVVFDRTLGPEEAGRVTLRALPDRLFDEASWWHRKEGVLDFFYGAVGLTHVGLAGEPRAGRHPWDPDQYELSLR